MPAGGGRDPYDARREAGRASRTQTRHSVLASADTLFRAKGYAATAVTVIADGAGVSLQMLCLAWGSKNALLQERTSAYSRGLATVFAAVAQRIADYWRINQDAAASDSDLAQSWQQLLCDRRSTMDALMRRMPSAGRHRRPSRIARGDPAALVTQCWSPHHSVLRGRVPTSHRTVAPPLEAAAVTVARGAVTSG